MDGRYEWFADPEIARTRARFLIMKTTSLTMVGACGYPSIG